MHTLFTQLYDLPPTQIGEIYDLELHTRRLPAPKLAYSMGHFSAIVSKSLHAHDRQQNSWWLLNKPEIRIGENILVPDVAGWQRSTLPALPEKYFETPCVWAAEFVSDNHSGPSRARRLEILAELEISYYWLVDTRKRMLSCFKNQNKRWALFKEIHDEPVRSVLPFNDEEFDFASVWNAESRKRS